MTLHCQYDVKLMTLHCHYDVKLNAKEEGVLGWIWFRLFTLDFITCPGTVLGQMLNMLFDQIKMSK